MKKTLSAFLIAISLSPATLLAQGETYIHTPDATYGPNGQTWIDLDSYAQPFLKSIES